MNVYDFDKTIYNGDSTLDFYKFILKKYPKILKYLPKQLTGQFLFILKRIDKTKAKEYFYSFVLGIDNIEKEITEFWDIKDKNIYSWYIEKHKADDVVISASPEFLLDDICCRLDIKFLIASKVNRLNGKCESPNCKGLEKVRRFREKFGNQAIDEFYSDSLSDIPLANISKKSYIIYKGKISDWII